MACMPFPGIQKGKVFKLKYQMKDENMALNTIARNTFPLKLKSTYIELSRMAVQLS